MKSLFAYTKGYIVVLLAVLVAAVWALVFGSSPVSGDKTPVRVTITRGATASEIGELLGKQGLVRSPLMFKLTCKASGASASLKPGVYSLNRSMSLPAIIDKLKVGESLEIWVTVPEGYNAAQIGDLMQGKQLVDGQSFIRIAVSEGESFASYPFIDSDSLEGYLFPDTYLVARGTSTEAIVKKMLDTFEQKVVRTYRPQLKQTISSRFGMGDSHFNEGLHRILTAASLVEREARTEEDRPLVAAVIWNRLSRNMRLEVDATVTYKPGESRENKERVLYRDLENDSPYNTYRRVGLPPGPICNPGLASIRAVLNPAPVDYLYYVAKSDGSHIFSRTYEQHLAAKRRARGGG